MQHIETIICPISAATSYIQPLKTQKDAKRVTRIQVYSSDITAANFGQGVSTLKSVNGDTYLHKVSNSLIWASLYQKSEERGLSLDFANIVAAGSELELSGTLAEDTGTLYITLFYG